MVSVARGECEKRRKASQMTLDETLSFLHVFITRYRLKRSDLVRELWWRRGYAGDVAGFVTVEAVLAKKRTKYLSSPFANQLPEL